MSWDVAVHADVDGNPVYLADWNYTHNCNGMANEVLGQDGPSWYRRLDGLEGAAAAALLHQILFGLNANPQHFRAMNPDNGWGDFDSFRARLEEMAAVAEKFPSSQWSASG